MTPYSSPSIFACLVLVSACANPLPTPSTTSEGTSTSTSTPDGSTDSSTTATSTGPDDTTGSTSGSSTGGPNLCGNGVIDPDEVCDGKTLPPGAACADEGFGEGMPGCVDDCTILDYTVCPAYDECGNDEVGFGEECDSTNLNGQTCADFPNRTGAGLVCSRRCTFDSGACLSCMENDEECIPGQDACCDPMASCGGVLTKECCLPGMCPLEAEPVIESFEPW